MLTSIKLEKFKCFNELKETRIAPLTIFCGTNSSGKSSILKSLLMLKQSYENESAKNQASFIGKYADCGFFDDVVHKGEGDTFSIINTFDINDSSNQRGYAPNRQDIISFKELNKLYYRADISIKSFRLSIDIEIKKNKNSTVTYIENNVLSKYTINISPMDLNYKPLDNLSGWINLELDTSSQKNNTQYIVTWKNIPNIKGKAMSRSELRSYQCYFSGMHLTNMYIDDMADSVKQTLPSLLAITRIAALQYDGLNFIAPLRQNPKRNYIIEGNVNSVGIAGEDTAILLTKLKSKSIQNDIALPLDYPNATFSAKNKCNFSELVNEWMKYFGLGELKVEVKPPLINITFNDINLVDVGFGASQALPIIVQGINMSKDETLLLEQPEIHLHPKMQLQMADFLIALAESNRNLIVETHSDLIINRIIRRILEDDSRTLHKDIQIYFVTQPDGKEAVVNDIFIDDTIGITNWIDEFFDQSAKEQLKIMKAGLLKREKIKKQ